MSNSPETPVPSMSEQMPALAHQFAETCRAKGVALDFLPRTLPLVDRLIKTAPASASPKAVTAYLGEVIARETGAFWYDFDDRPFLNVGDYQADPLTVVTAIFKHGMAHDGDSVAAIASGSGESPPASKNSGANSSIQASTPGSGMNCWTRPRATNVRYCAPNGTGVKSITICPLPRRPT